MGDMIAMWLVFLGVAATLGWVNWAAMEEYSNRQCISPSNIYCLNCQDGFGNSASGIATCDLPQ